jgi:hypothetical protein
MLVVFHVQPEYVDKKYLKKVLSKIKEFGNSNCLIINGEENCNFKELNDLNCNAFYTNFNKNFGWLINLQINNNQLNRELMLSFLSKYQHKELDFTDPLVIQLVNHLKSIKSFLQDDDLSESLQISLVLFRKSLSLMETIPNNSTIIGGSLDACLIELEMTLLFLNKPYKLDLEYCYKG